MRTFRVWWSGLGYDSEVIEAETAQDALTIATLNFKRFGFAPVSIKAETTERDREK